MSDKRKTEIIAVSSGKGGTGKTLISACLGYALNRAKHKVLMVDGDSGTDGLSLFMLGPDGMNAIEDFEASNTFRGVLGGYATKHTIHFEAYPIARQHDQGVRYTALISGTRIYGEPGSTDGYANALGNDVVPRLDQGTFASAVREFFELLRSDGEYDYVLVDTRGGFAFESTVVCALADSFIVVTEPDYTSFFQDRNLMKWINEQARALETHPVLRAVVVNKATNGEENSFRLELEKEFPIKFGDTHPIPLDVEVVKAYRHQQVPYSASPGSEFCVSSMRAFSRILHFVTSKWEDKQLDAWNALVKEVSVPYRKRRSFVIRAQQWTRANWAPFGVIAALFLVFQAWQTYVWQSEREKEQVMGTIFATDAPPALRVSSLLALYGQGEQSFNGLEFSGLDLSRTVLDGIQLNRAYLPESKFIAASLVDANFAGADLEAADLTAADLREANLGRANITEANITDVNLAGSSLDGANLQHAVLDRLHDWQTVRSIRAANLYAVKGAPEGFMEWAVKNGATCIADVREWRKFLRKKPTDAELSAAQKDCFPENRVTSEVHHPDEQQKSSERVKEFGRRTQIKSGSDGSAGRTK